MSYLDIELARTIDEDRLRRAERYHRVDKALAVRKKQSTNLIQNLVHWLRGVMKREGRVATWVLEL
jgi:hypothetical protein